MASGWGPSEPPHMQQQQEQQPEIPASAWGFGTSGTPTGGGGGGGSSGSDSQSGYDQSESRGTYSVDNQGQEYGTDRGDSGGWGVGEGGQGQGQGSSENPRSNGHAYYSQQREDKYSGEYGFGSRGSFGGSGMRGGRGGSRFEGGGGGRGPDGWPNSSEYEQQSLNSFGRQDRFSPFTGGAGGGGTARGGGFGGSKGYGELRPPDFSTIELSPFERDFYKEHSKVAERSETEVEQWRRNHSVTVDGQAPKPTLTWGETKLPKYVIKEYVVERGYQAPTTIQCQALPMALSGRDLIAISETGSGKTLAYAGPAMVHIAAQPPAKAAEGPIALVLAPTRELATQILRECQALGKGGNIRSACAYGGVPRNAQLADIRSGVDILIATPGRLIDFLGSGDLSLERVTYFVLDEADRMISLGFDRDVRQIISMIRPDRQTLMFSATFDKDVRSIAREFYRDAITVHLGLDVVTACSNIEQRVEICRNFQEKLQRLYQVLIEEVAPIEGKALIFVNTKATAIEVTEHLRSQSVEAISLHGDKRQEERDFALSEFRAGSIPVLVGTDVCQRGLDIPSVSIVINFDAPSDGASSYVHRIGRTGRAGNKGKALTFFGPRDSDAASKIMEVLATNNVEISQELQELAQGYGYSSTLPSFSTPEFDNDSTTTSAVLDPDQVEGWNRNEGGGGGEDSEWNPTGLVFAEPAPPPSPSPPPPPTIALGAWGFQGGDVAKDLEGLDLAAGTNGNGRHQQN